MINPVKINYNPNWPYILDHPHKILVVGGSGSGKTNVLLNLIKHQRPHIDKIYLYVKGLFESKYQLLINKRDKVGIKKLKNLKVFNDSSQTIDDVYKNLEEYNPTRKRRVLIVFDDMISSSYFKVPKTIRPNATHYLIMKIPNKKRTSTNSI